MKCTSFWRPSNPWSRYSTNHNDEEIVTHINWQLPWKNYVCTNYLKNSLAMQQKWLSGLSLLLIVGSSLLQRWSRSRSRSAFGADDRNQDRAFVDTTKSGSRPPPLVRAAQLAKYCHSGFPDSQSFVPPFFCDQPNSQTLKQDFPSLCLFADLLAW